MTHEGREQRKRDPADDERVERPPALLLRLHDRVDEDEEARRHRCRPGEVEALVRALVLRLRDELERRHEHRDPDRDVDEEDPRPRERVDEEPAEHEADRAAADGDRRPDAHRLRALGAFRERRRDDRERGGSYERGTQTLQAAAEDEDFRGRREAVQERRDSEDHDADEEDPLAPDEVAGAAAEQQEAAEDERVRVDDPLQVGIRHPQVGLDRRQRDVHDRRVQDHHELRHADQHEDEPRVDVTRARGCRADIAWSLMAARSH